MKKLIVIISLFLFSSIYSKPHIIIHMDINRTIIASDIKQKLGIDDIVNLSLSKKYIYKWENTPDPMSYYDYIYTIKYPGPRRDSSLRKLRRNDINKFIDYLRQINHSYYEKALCELQKAKNIMENRIVFPSFVKLIETLEEKNISFSLIFRSFGSDLDAVTKELNIEVSKASFKKGKLFTENGVIENPQHIFDYIKSYKWLGIQDDYFYWHKHNELKEYGKQFPLEVETETISIFFDDNIEFDAATNIVAPLDVKTKKYIPILPLIYKERLVPVNTIDAILDENYFIKFISKHLPE
jgi:hypothetical protein